MTRARRRVGVLLILAGLFLAANLAYGYTGMGYLGAGLLIGGVIYETWRGVLIDRDRERRRY